MFCVCVSIIHFVSPQNKQIHNKCPGKFYKLQPFQFLNPNNNQGLSTNLIELFFQTTC